MADKHREAKVDGKNVENLMPVIDIFLHMDYQCTTSNLLICCSDSGNHPLYVFLSVLELQKRKWTVKVTIRGDVNRIWYGIFMSH